MSIEKYEIFNTVATTRNFTKTGEILNITQSGISHAISSLEAEMGFKLFARGKGGITLTMGGERVLKYVRDILAVHEQLKKEAAGLSGVQRGTVTVASFTSVTVQWLPGIIQRFAREYPGIDISLMEGNYDDVNGWVTNRAVDFGFLSLSACGSLEKIPLKKDRLLCIVPEGHVFCSRAEVPIKDIDGQPFIMPKWGNRDDILNLMKEHHIEPRVNYEVMEYNAITEMVEKGLGISILPELVLDRLPGGVRALQLEETPYRVIGIVYASYSNMPAAAKRFCRYVCLWLKEKRILDFTLPAHLDL